MGFLGSRPQAGIFALLLFVVAGAFLAPPARAAGTPDISGSVSSSSILLGDPAHVTVSASNPSGPYGYNLSYRVVLPQGVSYAGGAPAAPTQIADQPSAGETTLLWSNLSDLSPGSTQQLHFDVSASTARYDVGSSFGVAVTQYVNSDPRTVPKFDGAGAADPASFTGSAGPVTGVQSISAVAIQQGEPSAEGEILRGVHDHQTAYTLTVRNNGVHPTTGVTVDDYLPAGLEFLGCGSDPDDHTTDAPTNPGSAEEYPGAGAIQVPPVSGCPAPQSVDTVTMDPDGPSGPLPTAVYTHVVWSLADLPAGGTQTIKFAAAVPLRANTDSWTGARPSAASRDQAANLDNNRGPEVTDETGLRNYVKVSGTYQGSPTQPVTDDSILDRSAEDWVVHKSVDDGTLAQGSIRTWTLSFATSEYKFAENATVTDTLPSGLCPLGAANYTTNNDPANDAECAADAGHAPSADYTDVTENADGTFTLVWGPAALAKLSHAGVSDSFQIVFSSLTRHDYQDNFLPTTPILSRDQISNAVTADATSFARCTSPGTADCSTTGPRIDGGDGDAVTDASSAQQTASSPTIDKRIAASGSDCATATYVDTVPHYHPGDRVCWQLRVDFPGAVDTSPQAIQDFLPSGATYDSGSDAAAPGNSVTANPVDASGGVLSWTVSGGSTVPSGALVFLHRFSSTVAPPGTIRDGDLTGNLMKFASTNTPGQSEPLRDQADYVIDAPTIGLTKGVAQVTRGGSTTFSTNAPDNDGITVQGGDQVTYRVDVTNTGAQDAQNVQVRDVLPFEYQCPLVANPDGGTCTDGGLGADTIKWTIPSVAAGASTTVKYTVAVPTAIAPNRTLANQASVLQYEGATNTGGTFTYTPGGNVAAATDGSSVTTRDVTVAKSATTKVTESGNAGSQATVGEEMTYIVTVTIPAGTTLDHGAALSDVVDPTRQPTVAGTPHAMLDGAPLPAGFVLDESGSSPTVTFPDGYAVPAGAPDSQLELQFRTKVADLVSNSRAAALTDRGHFVWNEADGTSQTRDSNTTSITIVEPVIAQTKSDDTGGAAVAPNQIVSYTLTTSNSSAANVSPAHDVVVTDHVPAGLTPVDANGDPLADGATISASDDAVWHSGTRTIEKLAPAIAPGASVAVSYRARVDSPAVAGSALTNSVATTATSLGSPADASGERTSYAASANDTIHIGAASVTKTQTPGTATIGEPVTSTLHVKIPGNVKLYDVTVTDVLPDDVEFDSYGPITCVSGCPVANTVATYVAETSGGTVTAAWDLGDFDTPLGADQQIELVVNGHIRATHRGGSTPVVAGNAATDSARIGSDRSDHPPSGTIPTTFDDVTTPATATTSVTEPHVSVDKQVKVGGGAYGDGPATTQADKPLAYRVTVKNTGDSPAYDVVVTDRPDDELTSVVSQPQAGVIVTDDWTAGDPGIAWQIDGPIAPGASVTLDYTATLAPVSGLHDGEAIDNIAAVPHYYGVSGGASDTTRYRDYTDGGSDAATVLLDFPTLTMTKTTGLPGFPDSGFAEVGQDFPWRLVITNTSTTADAKQVRVEDRLPPNWTYRAGSASLDPTTVTASAGLDLVVWTLPAVPAGQTVVITYDAWPDLAARTVPGLGPNANPNVAQVTAAEDSGHNPGNADGTYGTPSDWAWATLIVPQLTLVKTPDGGTAVAGTTTDFTLTVTNTGSGTARNVDVHDALPPGLSYTTGSATASPSTGFSETADPSGADVHFRLATLGPGQSVSITMPVLVGASVPDGTAINNQATVTADEAPEQVQDSGSVSVHAQPDLSIGETGAPTFTPGENYTWHLHVHNQGPSDAVDSVVTDMLPPGTTFVSADAPCTESGGLVTCALGTLAAGFDHTYDLTAAVSPAFAGSTMANVVDVTAPNDSDTANNESLLIAMSASEADLSVTKSAAAGTILKNATTTFTLTVHNAGPSDAHSVQLVDALPSGLEFVSADDPDCHAFGTTVTCDLGDLPGGDRTVNVVARGIANGDWTNTATVTSSTPEPPGGGAPNASSVQVTVSPVADLALSKTGPADVAAGGRATWTLEVANQGPDGATGVVISDPLPAGVSFVDADPGCTVAGGVVTCAVGALANGDTATRTITAEVPLALASTSMVNLARVTSDQGDDHPSDNDASAATDVGPSADLAIAKQGPAQVAADGAVAWTLVATNHGPSTATHVVVDDVLPDGVQLVSATPTKGSCGASAGHVTCDLGALARDGSAQIQVVAHVPPALEGSTLRNGASIHGAEPDPVTANDSAAATTTVGPPPIGDFDLRVTQTASASPELGKPFEYTITVVNAGPATATDVNVVDTLPSSVRFISAAGCSAHGSVVSCGLGTLRAGESRTITVRVRLVKPGSVRNTVSVRSAVADIEPRNDTASVQAAVSAPRTSLAVRMTPGRKTVRPGKKVTFTIRVRNSGGHAAAGVTVCDRLPSPLAYVSAKHARFRRGNVCWTVGLLPAHASRKVAVTLRVARSARAAKVRNVVIADAANAAKRRASASVRLAGKGGLRGGGVTG